MGLSDKPFIYTRPLLLLCVDPPEAPGKPTVIEKAANTMTIKWTAPDNDGGAPITNYIIEYRVHGDKKWLAAKRDTPSNELTFTVPGLKEETEYEFRVAAENKAGPGPFSEPSDVAKFGKSSILLLTAGMQDHYSSPLKGITSI